MIGLALVASSASAHPDDPTTPTKVDLGDQILPPPPTYKASGVTVEEHVGAQLPLDVAFQTIEGKHVTLREVLAGDLPTILTFNYSDCPMLCSVQLNGLTAALPKVALPGPAPGKAPGGSDKPVVFRLGEQFRIVTIDLEPKESLAKLGKMRDRYIARFPVEQQAKAREGWTFLAAATPGDGAQIHQIADVVGFKYAYVEDRAEWAHPASLIFLAANGTVTRYVYGIEFGTDLMRESIFAAGLAEPRAAAGFMLRCYHFDPEANSGAHTGVMALRVGAVGFVFLMLTGLGVLHFVRRRSQPEAIRS